ncbi:ArsR/SmtB family transcription factor [Ancylobacter amanitiformis]|uniref:DNA-binding transcriptional ArsR family regulator n=1 Tax=Ancylobacter amanitiformis TaxID=217069 RepID=A0ABU0LW94_9HYPH|nr:metalloregulator ArsR/SmtB family transcription factor [Ancylobacter amanitiformis]MDQ0512991.1 DNA-binding transcriptional ArsR family regulator [Ancylobacter amanitiformis]
MPLTREEADRAVEKLRSYGQPQRLMILSHLQSGEMTVGEIDAATAIGQPALSQQLGELRRAGLVATRRAAKQVYYRLADSGVAQCVRSIEAQFSEGVAAPSPPAAPAAAPAPRAARDRSAALFARIVGPGGSPA